MRVFRTLTRSMTPPFDPAHVIQPLFLTLPGDVGRNAFTFRIGAVGRVLAGDYVDSLLVTQADI